MNKIKVDMVSFLMRSFEDYMSNPKGVSIFKSNVNDLVNRNQIYPDVRDIVFQIYGIVNTDVFKPTVCEDKVYKINMYISKSKMLGVDSSILLLEKFKLAIDNDLKAGFINKQIKDILYNIFDFNKIHNEAESVQNKSVKQQIDRFETKKRDNPSTNVSSKLTLIEKLKLKGASQKVINDVCLFKDDCLESLYYEYPNVNYDGCSNSSPYLHTALLKALRRPKGSVIKLYKKVADDGCHSTWAYIDIPKDCYIKPKIETPKGTGRGISACDAISGRSRVC